MSSISITIYVESQLLKPRFSNGKLVISRKVLGAPNIIAWETPLRELYDKVNIKWDQKYKIGASKTPAADDGFVHVATSLKPIASGQTSDWIRNNNDPPREEMPDAAGADNILLMDWPKGSGAFGTKDQPYTWYNSIWCADRDEIDWCIYAETKPTPPGQQSRWRSYQVTHNFEISWEVYDEDSTTVLMKSSYDFLMPTTSDNLTKFLSLGRHYDSGTTNDLTWLEYEKDPNGYDPSKGIARTPPTPIKPLSIRLHLKWTGRGQEEMIKRENARAVFDFLRSLSGGWYTLQNPLVLSDLQVDIALNPGVAFGHYLI